MVLLSRVSYRMYCDLIAGHRRQESLGGCGADHRGVCSNIDLDVQQIGDRHHWRCGLRPGRGERAELLLSLADVLFAIHPAIRIPPRMSVRVDLHEIYRSPISRCGTSGYL